jgi:hypothetical protein
VRLAAASVLLITSVASARPVRPLFEPTDLEMEEPGILDVDLQMGVIRGAEPGPYRVVTPDFELDIGILTWLELDIDGTYAVDEDAHAVPDNLWLSAKIWRSICRGHGSSSARFRASRSPRPIRTSC